LEIDMNTFFASAGRALANVVDGTIDFSRKTVTETSGAREAFVAGWKSQLNERREATLRRTSSSSSPSGRSTRCQGLRGDASCRPFLV
jgi:hypothetical protein